MPKQKATHACLVTKYGTLWARNEANIKGLHDVTKDSPNGVYVLRDGSMPVYVGHGNLWHRIMSHTKSKTKRNSWDHFSWYVIPDPILEHECEALVIRMLPFYLRTFNRQKSDFLVGKREKESDPNPEPIKRPSFKIQKKSHRRRK